MVGGPGTWADGLQLRLVLGDVDVQSHTQVRGLPFTATNLADVLQQAVEMSAERVTEGVSR